MAGEIATIYAFLTVDEHGQEGILAHKINTLTVPFVTSDPEVAAKLGTFAKQITKETGLKILFCKFSAREVLDNFAPEVH
jgi:hypothetical protein